MEIKGKWKILSLQWGIYMDKYKHKCKFEIVDLEVHT